MRVTRGLWIALAVLAALTPVGLILPAAFGAGDAWGEWGLDEVRHLVGYVPAGMARLAEIWKAPLPDYSLPGQGDAPLAVLSGSYVLSALAGMAVVAVITILLGRALARRNDSDAA